MSISKIPRYLSQLFIQCTMNYEKKVVNLCENNKQSVTKVTFGLG